jgi:hypothetical protein
VIARTYYDPDEDEHAATPGAMERHLTTMLDTLVALALAHGSTVLADHLRASDHAIGAWLRPRVTRRLKGEGIGTLGELIAFCNRRVSSWWRSIPRIGPGRARAVVSWLRRQEKQLQLTVEAGCRFG